MPAESKQPKQQQTSSCQQQQPSTTCTRSDRIELTCTRGEKKRKEGSGERSLVSRAIFLPSPPPEECCCLFAVPFFLKFYFLLHGFQKTLLTVGDLVAGGRACVGGLQEASSCEGAGTRDNRQRERCVYVCVSSVPICLNLWVRQRTNCEVDVCACLPPEETMQYPHGDFVPSLQHLPASTVLFYPAVNQWWCNAFTS